MQVRREGLGRPSRGWAQGVAGKVWALGQTFILAGVAADEVLRMGMPHRVSERRLSVERWQFVRPGRCMKLSGHKSKCSARDARRCWLQR